MNVSGFEIGDLVILPTWHEYLPVVDVHTYKIKLQEDDAVAWYDTRDFEFTKKEVDVNEQTKADEFKIGDVVWCAMYGRGIVEEACNTKDMLGVGVSFDSGEFNWYTKDGKYNTNLSRTLFFSEPKIEASVTRPFVPTLVGKTVMVREYGCYLQSFVVEWENLDSFGDELHSCLKVNCEVYEVSSENLLK